MLSSVLKIVACFKEKLQKRRRKEEESKNKKEEKEKRKREKSRERVKNRNKEQSPPIVNEEPQAAQEAAVHLDTIIEEPPDKEKPEVDVEKTTNNSSPPPEPVPDYEPEPDYDEVAAVVEVISPTNNDLPAEPKTVDAVEVPKTSTPVEAVSKEDISVNQASSTTEPVPSPPAPSPVTSQEDLNMLKHVSPPPQQIQDVDHALAVVDRCSLDSGTCSDQTKPAGHFVVVAIDFGTTLSGYAFSFTRDPDTILMMRKWEGGDPGVVNQKLPTCLLLDPQGLFHSFGFTARDFYHDLDAQEAKKYCYFDKFKMALHYNAVSYLPLEFMTAIYSIVKQSLFNAG